MVSEPTLEEDTVQLQKLWLFTFSNGAHSISKEVAGFSPLRFPQGKLFVSCLL